MSIPKNPFDQYETLNTKHLLLAFKYTESACKSRIPEMDVGVVGTVLEPPIIYCGKAIVVVNEFMDNKYFINNLSWTFSYYSPIEISTTSLLGNVQIASQINYEFPSFLAKVSEQLDMSITHITWWLRTCFIGTRGDGGQDYHFAKPLIFHVADNAYSIANQKSHLYGMNFMATYNTYGQLLNFSGVHQLTITHKDGALHKEIPKPEAPNCEILTRAEEDAAKAEARSKRLEKSKPMKTLKDIFEALEIELKEQRFAHKRQLQEWMTNVRDGYVKKIEEPEQKKGEELPLDYIIAIGDAADGPVDNRNMPWEQPEQGQDKPGIRSITIPPGLNIISAIDYIMKYSKKMGIQSADGGTWKTNICIVRRCGGKYDVFINVNGAEIPKNSLSTDTGPGKGTVSTPLTFTFSHEGFSTGEGDINDDIDITNLHVNSNSDIDWAIMEEQVEEDEAEVNYGSREQMTFERIPTKKYFKSQFSGIRGMSSPKNYGLESAEDAAKIDMSFHLAKRSQTSRNMMKIRGNFELYSDLCRNPWKVKNNDPDLPVLYKFPERYPIYMKVRIKLNREGGHLGQENVEDNEIDSFYYHTNHYHATSITNVIQGSHFYQLINLARVDDFV
jgi:hypothetical protein